MHPLRHKASVAVAEVRGAPDTHVIPALDTLHSAPPSLSHFSPPSHTSHSSSHPQLQRHRPTQPQLQIHHHPHHPIVLPASASDPASAPVLCRICCEHVPPNSLRGCATCTHRYCAKCVDKYWTRAIYSGQHTRLLCMYAGCGVFASDFDIASVVSQTAFRKMLYFRSRDIHQHYPNARWCAAELCWEYLGVFPIDPSENPPRPPARLVQCTRCQSHTCIKCERQVKQHHHEHLHSCSPRRPNKSHTALFGVWAMLHTKSCPACGVRIQRNHGCSHMTCTRCSSYFCWRCKGFLNNGCPLPGRACICDLMTTVGLTVVSMLGSPALVVAALLGGPPYLVYRTIRARRARRPPSDHPAFAHARNETSLVRSRRARVAATAILHSDELYSHDDEFDSASSHYTSQSDIPEDQNPSARTSDTIVRLRRVRLQRGPDAQEGLLVDTSTRLASDSTAASQPLVIEAPFYDPALEQPLPVVRQHSRAADLHGVAIDSCQMARPFILERKRGSGGKRRVVRRSIP